jgi:hypothetical protein
MVVPEDTMDEQAQPLLADSEAVEDEELAAANVKKASALLSSSSFDGVPDDNVPDYLGAHGGMVVGEAPNLLGVREMSTQQEEAMVASAVADAVHAEDVVQEEKAATAWATQEGFPGRQLLKHAKQESCWEAPKARLVVRAVCGGKMTHDGSQTAPGEVIGTAKLSGVDAKSFSTKPYQHAFARAAEAAQCGCSIMEKDCIKDTCSGRTTITKVAQGKGHSVTVTFKVNVPPTVRSSTIEKGLYKSLHDPRMAATEAKQSTHQLKKAKAAEKAVKAQSHKLVKKAKKGKKKEAKASAALTKKASALSKEAAAKDAIAKKAQEKARKDTARVAEMEHRAAEASQKSAAKANSENAKAKKKQSEKDRKVDQAAAKADEAKAKVRAMLSGNTTVQRPPKMHEQSQHHVVGSALRSALRSMREGKGKHSKHTYLSSRTKTGGRQLAPRYSTKKHHSHRHHSEEHHSVFNHSKSVGVGMLKRVPKGSSQGRRRRASVKAGVAAMEHALVRHAVKAAMLREQASIQANEEEQAALQVSQHMSTTPSSSSRVQMPPVVFGDEKGGDVDLILTEADDTADAYAGAGDAAPFEKDFAAAVAQENGGKAPAVTSDVKVTAANQASKSALSSQLGGPAPPPSTTTTSSKKHTTEGPPTWFVVLLIILLLACAIGCCVCIYCNQGERSYSPWSADDPPAEWHDSANQPQQAPMVDPSSSGFVDPSSSGFGGAGGTAGGFGTPRQQQSQERIGAPGAPMAEHPAAAPSGMYSGATPRGTPRDEFQDPRRVEALERVALDLRAAESELDRAPWYKKAAVQSRIAELNRWKGRLEDENSSLYGSAHDPTNMAPISRNRAQQRQASASAYQNSRGRPDLHA